MMIKSILITALLQILLISCSSNRSSNWDCPAPSLDGKSCRSIEKSDNFTNSPSNPIAREQESATYDKHNFSNAQIKSAIIVNDNQKNDNQKDNTIGKQYSNNASNPARTSETVGRLWFAPFIDKEGNYHDESVVYMVDSLSKWEL